MEDRIMPKDSKVYKKVAKLLRTQTTRDALTLFLFFAFFFAYYQCLKFYLSNLQWPEPLLAAFMFSLGINIYYELKQGFSRMVNVRIVCTVAMFCIAAVLAQEVREIYLEAIAVLSPPDGSEGFIGQEYMRAAQNRVVGVGGCFAIGLITSRLMTYKLLVSTCSKALLLPIYRSGLCPSCSQQLPSH